MQELCTVKRNYCSEIAIFLKEVLPNVLIKTVYEKNFIVIEAKQTLA